MEPRESSGLFYLFQTSPNDRRNGARVLAVDSHMATSRASTVYELDMRRLNGKAETLRVYEGEALLVVNVASKCGFTPQYAGLQTLYERYHDRGFWVLGFPCNQFFRQEPGDAAQIQEFCRANYGVSFPLFAKLDVKGPHEDPLYVLLSQTPDDAGKAGNVAWNFEKFLLARDGTVAKRFRSRVAPEDPLVIEAIEALL